MAVLDLEQRVASVVTAQLDSANGRIEELIERALQAELDRRVAALLEAELEGRATDAPLDAAGELLSADSEWEPGWKTCTTCNRNLPDHKYEKGRRQCRECRRNQHAASKERRRQEEEAAPFPGSTLRGSPPANPPSLVKRLLAEERRAGRARSPPTAV